MRTKVLTPPPATEFPPFQFDDTVDLEPEHRKILKQLGHKYRNRVCVPMTQDRYLESTRNFLEVAQIRYARVPFRRQQEVYFFFTIDDVSTFIRHHEELQTSH